MCGSKGSTTTSSTFSPPAGVQANYDYLANQAKSVASLPFQQYGGQMVAPMTPEQQAGIGQINASANLAQPYIQAGTAYEQQGANPFGQEALNQYMSPYIGSVANATMANLNETNAQQQQQVLGSDIARGAYGGDRSQVAQSELARQQGLATGQTMSGIYQGGFNQAEQQFNADQARRMAAGQTLAGFGSAAQNAAMQGGQAMMSAGAQQQAYQQALDSANQQQFQAAQAYPFETTQFLGNLLLGIGGQSGGTSLTSQPGPNVGSQLLGGLMTLGSIPWGSDERLKENMEPVGKTFDGQNIYKFNYKNDGRTMLGLSAQEVEKHTPEAVHKDGQGMRSVDYETAVNKAAKRGHFADGGVPDWMGGAVHEGLGRAHFATAGSVSDIPYTSQPLGGTGTTPLSLKDLMPLVSLISEGKLGGKTNIPNAPAPLEEGTMMDVAKQLQGMSSEQRANMKANIGSVDSILNPAPTTPGTAIGESQGTYSLGLNYAAGGVAGRGAYKDGQTVQPSSDDTTDQTAPSPTPSSGSSFSLGNILPSKGQSVIEKATGLDLSDNARMGMLAAGLGMLSSRSPFFGVGVGEGATAGLGTYYNAKANDRAYANKQRELEMTQEQRDIEKQRVGLEAQKTPADIAKSQADAIEALQRAKTAAGAMYIKVWIPGVGYIVSDANNPMRPPVRITDEKMQPLGNIDPTSIPSQVGLPAKAQEPASTVGATKAPVTAPAVATPPNVNAPPVTTPEQKTEWKPVTTVPDNYSYPGSTNLALVPGAMEKAQASAEKIKADQDSKSQGAFDTLYTLDNMDRSFNDVSKTGLLAPGQHIDERTNFAVGVNTMASIIGGKPIFDPTDVASLEELAKDNKRLGFALSKSMGREPGFIVQQAITANPGAANTPLGFHRITEALRQAAQYEQDRNAFYDSYKAKFGHLEGANDLFTKLNPPEQYANKAIVNSIDPTHLSEIRQWASDNQGKDLSAGQAQFDKIYGKNAFKLATGQ